MAKSSEKDRAAASYMKAHPGQFPDSTMRPGQGEGAAIRKMASQMSAAGHRTSKWDVGMFGGVLAPCCAIALTSRVSMP